MLCVLGRKNQKRRFFLSKSMPNFNFAKVQLKTQNSNTLMARQRLVDSS